MIKDGNNKDSKSSNIKDGNNRASNFSTDGVHGAKTHAEKKEDANKVLDTNPVDAVISFENDKPHQFSDPNDSPMTVSAGEGINISHTGNDYMISIDFEETAEELIEEGDITASASASPWLLSATTDADAGTHTFRVASAISSITNFTNGDAIDLTGAGMDVEVAIVSTSYIVLEATVTALVASAWTIVATTDLEESREVGLTPPAPPALPEQDKLRLRIGKVTIADGVATATQFADDCKILGYDFLNGTLVLVLNDHEFNEIEVV